MAEPKVDLFVIGAGSGGVRAARMAAGYGATVAIAEESRVGGTCVIRGCVPKKLLAYAAHFHEDFEDAVGFGWSLGEARFDWARLIASKDREIDRLNAIYIKLLDNAGVMLHPARARLADAHTLEVGDKRISAERILIATGAHPVRPNFPGAEHVITSDEAFHLPSLPRRIAILGGGYIAVEFAGIFNGLGAEVHLLYRGEQILRGFDDDVRFTLSEEIVKKGIDLRCGRQVARIEKAGEVFRVVLQDEQIIEVDAIMAAIGRTPNTAGMGLAEAGVALDAKGAVAVDATSQSSLAHIHAVGDVTNRVNLTPVAIREAVAYADSVFGNRPWTMDHTRVPSAVFSQPPVGVVGLGEAAARHALGAVDIYRVRFRPLKHTLSGRDEKTMMKLVVERKTQRVVGAHMVGLDAPEIIQAVAIAVTMGATKDQFDAAVAIHPTAAEEFVTMRQKVPEPTSEAVY